MDAERRMDVQRESSGTQAQRAEGPPDPGGEGQPDRAAPSAEPEAGQQAGQSAPLDEAESLNRMSKILLAVVPALTVALAAVGSATGGLARMFRDQTGAARASIALIFLSFALAALARRPITTPGGHAGKRARLLKLRAGMLLLSGVTLVVGIAWAFDAQITVMGRGQAPAVTGSVTPTSSGDALDAHVVATGVKSSNRVVVLAFASSDEHGDTNSTKVPLYYSKSGPDAEGQVDVHVVAQVPGSDLQAFPYVFVTAVLGEDQRDCDGALIEGTGPAAPEETACLTLQRPGAPTPSSASSPAASAPASTGGLTSPTAVTVSGSVAWTDTGLSLTQGQRFVVQATGQVSFIEGAAPVGPDGATDPHPGANVLPGPDHHTALIARISDGAPGAPFLVGSTFDGPADRGGQLQLGINDAGVDNNAGAFEASIQVAAQ
jgi:hypothetical protein